MKELSLNILDIAQNSIRAKAGKISIVIEESEKNNSLRITISDDGSGIPAEMLAEVTDPYTTSRTSRKVGLGLPFLKQHAEITGGNLKIESKQGKGTQVEANFVLNHLDRQPMGDISGVIKLLIMANPRLDFFYLYKTDEGEFSIGTPEIKKIFGVNELTDNNLMKDIREMMLENLRNIGAKA